MRPRAPHAPVLTIWLASLVGCASGGPRGIEPGGNPAETPDDPVPQLSGGCGEAAADLTAKYVLPFAVGESFSLTQGNCGTASHGGRFSFAFDFRMPVGTPVIAARDGVVYTVRADRPDGSRRVGDENYVFLEHDDGEFSRYIHLTTGGVLVRRGDGVTRGDTIAHSGNSGQSSFPHLHFDVAVGCRAGPCVTVGAAFLNATSPIPTELAPYTAGPATASGAP